MIHRMVGYRFNYVFFTNIRALRNITSTGINTTTGHELVAELDKSRQNKKLYKKLEISPAKELSKRSIGIQEFEGVHYAEILNDALNSNNFIRMFRGLSNPAMVIEIKEVRVLGDGSQFVALWNSVYLEKFINDVKAKYGVDEGDQVSERIVKYICKKLQDKEPSFRAALVRKMDFKRVPKISFRVHNEWCQALPDDFNAL